MAKVTVKLEGARVLRDSLRELPQILARKVVRQAARAAARPVLATAKEDVPEDTGKLKRSLKIRATRRSRKLIGVVVRTGTPAELGDGSARYAPVMEYGAPRINVQARPYIRPGLFDNEGTSLRIMARALEEGIQREGSRLGRRGPR